MKQPAGSFRGSCRLVALAVVAGSATLAGLGVDREDTRAEAAGLVRADGLLGGEAASGAQLGLPSVSLPSLSTPSVSVPSLSTPSVSVPSLSTPVGSTPQVTVPSVSTPQVTVPSVSTPQVTVPSVSTPPVAVGTQPGSTPATPPSTPTPSMPAEGAPAPSGPTADAKTPPAPTGGVSTAAPAGGAQRLPVGGAGGGSGSLPSPPQGGDAPVAATASGRAAAVRDISSTLLRASHEPLHGARLSALRAALREHRGCLAALPDRGRRVLSMRAGLGDRHPASRHVVARRLGVSLRQALAIERASLRALAACGAVAAKAGDGRSATVVPAAFGADGRPPAARFERSVAQDRGGVLAAARSGPAAVPVIDVRDDAGSADALALLAVAVLGPLAVALMAGRGRRTRPSRP